MSQCINHVDISFYCNIAVLNVNIAYFIFAGDNVFIVKYVFYTHEVILKTCGITGAFAYILYTIPVITPLNVDSY